MWLLSLVGLVLVVSIRLCWLILNIIVLVLVRLSVRLCGVVNLYCGVLVSVVSGSNSREVMVRVCSMGWFLIG